MGEASPRAKRKALMIALPAVVLAGLVFVWARDHPLETAPEPAVAPAAAPDAGTEAPAEAEAGTEAPAGAPTFDLVRVEPDGSAAVAGTAEPGAKVTIYADKAPLAEAEADAEGNFVAMFEVAPSAVPRALTLAAKTADGVAASSEDVVMLLPQAPAAPEPEAPAVPEEAPAVVATTAETSEPEPAPEVAATAIVRADSVEVMPPAVDPASARDVTLASVSYAEQGEVTLAGVGTAGSVVRAYVDDRFAKEARVAADGRWRMVLGGVAEGIYRLRIDQLAADGKVASRVETPFQRDYPPPPPPRPAGASPGLGPSSVTVTVQPGNNLWTLAQERYGSGVMYSQIFTANRTQIRDPNLIYPGQIFSLPEPGAVE